MAARCQLQQAAEPEAEAGAGPGGGYNFAGTALADLVVERRAGRRVSTPGYYGCNSAVFDVHLASRADLLLSLKVVYNVEEVATNDLEEHFQSDFQFQARLPPHPAVLPVLHHFTDTASQLTLGRSWDADPEFTRERSLFVLMERMERTLKQLTTERQQAGHEPPFFSAREFLQIAVQITSAAAHLHEHRVVHRDLKPDNILLTTAVGGSGSGGGGGGGGLVAKLADFGEALDAGEYCEDGFCLPFPAPAPRGGASFYLPPEVLQPRAGRGVLLDYNKSDAWAVGLVLYGMWTPLLQS